MSDGLRRWWVDPGSWRRRLLGRSAAHEALGMRGVGGVEHALPRGDDGGRATVVHVGGMHEREADVVVLVVVPGDEGTYDLPRVLEGAELIGHVGPVLHRAEVRLGVRVVVRRVRPAVALGDAEA